MAVVGGGAAEAPGYDVELTGRATNAGGAAAGELDGTTATFVGQARARHRRTGHVDEAQVSARVGRQADFEVRVDGQRMTLADLGDDARSANRHAGLPDLADGGARSLRSRASCASPRAMCRPIERPPRASSGGRCS
jgi:hypothetical protein